MRRSCNTHCLNESSSSLHHSLAGSVGAVSIQHLASHFSSWFTEAARLSKILAIRQHTCSQRGSKSQGNSMKSSLFSASKPRRLELGRLLSTGARLVLHGTQGTQRRLLRLGQPSNPGDIEPLVGPVAPQRAQMFATL